MLSKSTVKNLLVNSVGWRTKRKLVVFESDDWGSIRMSSKKAYNYLMNKGYPVDRCAYNRNDMLESNDDVEQLLDTLSSFKDKNNNPPIFTLNNIVANPDFKKIMEDDFQIYHYEPFTETLKRYKNHDRVFELLNEGVNNSFFKMQFHGREHINVRNWMGHLKQKDAYTMEAFELEMFSFYKGDKIRGRIEYLDTFRFDYNNDTVDFRNDLESGLDIFNKLWGYSSKSFIAPIYNWSVDVEKWLHDFGVKYLQGLHIQRVPDSRKLLSYKKKYHYLGQTNKFGQIYLVRNAIFEPTSNPTLDWVTSCMKEINIAFAMKKPAIISTHRVNFMGGLIESNRDANLRLLKQLLDKLLKKYPDVEFISSDQLGELISNTNN